MVWRLKEVKTSLWRCRILGTPDPEQSGSKMGQSWSQVRSKSARKIIKTYIVNWKLILKFKQKCSEHGKIFQIADLLEYCDKITCEIAFLKQECIPVGCLPAASRPYAGVCFGGVSAWSGGCLLPGGWCLPGLGGWCLPGPGGCLPGGGVVSAWSRGGGVCLVRGGLPCPGGLVSQYALRQTPSPPVNRMTNRCKNITLATTSLRPVKMLSILKTQTEDVKQWRIQG